MKQVFQPSPSLKISIVIPTLNSPWLAQTLTALKKQTYPVNKIEVLVVGLAHADVIANYQFVRFIDTGVPVPPAVSRNRGLVAARGDIICFLDDDCIPHPLWLEALIAVYSNPKINVVGGAIQFPSNGYWARCDALASAYEQLNFRKAGVRRQLPSMNFSARRDLLLELNGFDESYPYASGEDAELCMRLRRNGHQLYFEPKALIYHLGWRNTWISVWQHIYRYGQFSPWISPALADVVNPPIFFKHWSLLLFVTPVLSIWISVRMFLRSPHLLQSLELFPGVLFTQLAWCSGVLHQLYRQAKKQS